MEDGIFYEERNGCMEGTKLKQIKRVLVWVLSILLLVTTVNLPGLRYEARAEGERTELLPYVYARTFTQSYWAAWTEERKESAALATAKKLAKAYFGSEVTVEADAYNLEVVTKDGLEHGDQTAATTFIATLSLTDAGSEKYTFNKYGTVTKEFTVSYHLMGDDELPFVPVTEEYYPAFYGPAVVTVDVNKETDENIIRETAQKTVEDAYEVYFGGSKVDESYYTVSYEPVNDEVYCDTFRAAISLTETGKKKCSLSSLADSLKKEIKVVYTGLPLVEGTVEITSTSEQLSKTWDGKPAAKPEFTTSNAAGENDENVTFEYKKNTDSEYSTVVPSDAGTYEVRVIVAEDDTYKQAVSEPVTFTISKANPSFTKPENLAVNCKSKLSDIILPEGFVWEEPETIVAAGSQKNAGTVTVNAIYIPKDTTNYENVVVKLNIKVGHVYTENITKEATAESDGIKLISCSECGYSYEESIPKLSQPTKPAPTPENPQPTKPAPTPENPKPAKSVLKKGTKISVGKAEYVVTKSAKTGAEVAYTKLKNKKATSVSIPATIKKNGITYKVTSVADSAFANNKKLTKVTIGGNVKTIGKKAFYKNTKLKTVTLGKNITTIGDKAFYKCTSLKKVTIPSKVKKIGKQAFYGCSKLKTITIKTAKLTGKKIGSKAFGKISAKATFKVPKKKLSAYKKVLKSKGISKKTVIKKI